jgi:mannose-6-phosphate isomerase-like protein (cupin superfamily)
MDLRFSDIYNDPSVSMFQVVFFPDRIYHDQYLNATRSERYRYNVQEVRTKAEITVLKGEVYKDSVFYTTFVRVEYRSARLVEAMRVKGRLQGMAVRARIRFWLDGEQRDLRLPQFLNDGDPVIRLYYCPWVDAYQVELWETLELPEGDFHDIEVLTMMGRYGGITRVPRLADRMKDPKQIREVDLEFMEDDITETSGYYLPDSEVSKDNFYFRNLQVPNTNTPSDNASNTVPKGSYTLNFMRGFYIPDARQIQPVRYRNAMMFDNNPDRRDDNILEMRWLLQDEFSSSLVFFHEVAIPPGVVEGTHQHIGSEELYFIYEGEGIAYMGAHDHPALDQYRVVDRHIFGLDPKPVRELPVKTGSVIFTKSGGIHGIRNTSATATLRFVAFLYQSA